jgi:hypothetical protein
MAHAGSAFRVTMRVRHFGNTANNAYHNVLLLAEYAGLESELPIRMFGLDHAISSPAWETVDFEVPDSTWVAHPDWSPFPDAVAVNSEFTDLSVPAAATPSAEQDVTASPGLMTALRSRLFGPLRRQSWALPLVELRDRQTLAARPVHAEVDGAVDLLYGSGSMFVSQLPRPATHTVCMEHGTIRWVADGNREEKAFRDAYRRQVQQAMHLWVTNLDPRTLEVAEDVAPGRWSAFPHPFFFDERVPFPESAPRRAQLLRETASESLVLLAASQNWSKDHDKGSMTALTAFVELRRRGVELGLVAVEWGHQVAESKEFLERSGVGGNVVWVPPMARLPLQRTMANVDVVWDQFGLEVFGALALRTLEQGTPLVSRGLAASGIRFIGGPVPWHAAATTDEIVHETIAVLEEMGRSGREAVIAATRARGRIWLDERHSPAVSAVLQRDRYQAILDGTFARGSVAVDEWTTRSDAALQKGG